MFFHQILFIVIKEELFDQMQIRRRMCLLHYDSITRAESDISLETFRTFFFIVFLVEFRLLSNFWNSYHHSLILSCHILTKG